MRHGRSQADRKESGSLICGPVQLAFLLVLGVWSADLYQLPPLAGLSLIIVALALSQYADHRQHPWLSVACVWLAVVLGGHSLAVQRLHYVAPDDIRLALESIEPDRESDGPAILSGQVVSIPSERTRRESMSVWTQQENSQDLQTTFLMDVQDLVQGDIRRPVSGRLRVLVQGQFHSDGNGALPLSWGDQIQVTGFPEPPTPPHNPGEFDFGLLMQQQGISGSLYVKHPLAVRTTSRPSEFDPRVALTRLRSESVRLLYSHLSDGTAPLAEALLLGNRGHLSTQVQNDYINSGTMHLLAISGLHVGILYVFLTRIFQLLKVPGNRALVAAAALCFTYAVLTDLRPSVLRSAAFIVLIVLAQLWNRRLRMQVLIGNVATLLILFDPGIAYDTGAWLSFVAVGALGWVTHVSPARRDDVELPRVDFTWRERLTRLAAHIRHGGRQQLQQMGAVTCLSGPIVASQFHVVSLISFPANAVLIPLTTVAMITGFVFLGLGIILPESGMIVGPVLDIALRLMNGCVSIMADIPYGWMSIPDLPTWFCGVYFLCLIAASVTPARGIRRAAWVFVALLTVTAFGHGLVAPASDNLRLTVLSVGHGNAVVAETPDGRLLLIDAGALRRSERTADVIAQFLWERGYRQVDALVISHADMDHFNAVPALLGRVRIGAVYTSQDFVRSDSKSANWLMEHLRTCAVPVHLVTDGDSLLLNEISVDFLQPETDPEWSDNERSLVVMLKFAGRSICLPGDLEQRGLEELIEVVATCDVLLSPHHGSPASNPPELYTNELPGIVIISGDDSEHADVIRSRTEAGKEILLTSDVGAVTVEIDKESSDLRVFACLPQLSGLSGFPNSD